MTTTPIPLPSDMAALSVGLLKESGSVAKAEVFARLAQAQQAKATNIINYLNSDRSRWSEEDEGFVRAYLGLPPTQVSGVSA